MMHSKKLLFFSFYLLLGWLIFSSCCSNVVANSNIKINKIDYYVANFHPSYFGGDEDSNIPRLLLNIDIKIDGLSKTIKQIANIKLSDSLNNSFDINLKSQSKNIKKNLINIAYVNTKLSEKSALLPTKYKITITTKDNQVIEEQIFLSEPGKSDVNDKNYIYNEAYRGKAATDYFQTLKMGTIKSAVISNKTITVDFVVNEPRAFNGLLIFLDKKHKYLGETRAFKTPFSGEIITSLNDGQDFYTNNKVNQIVLNEAQISKTMKLAKVKYVALMLTDGAQFLDTDQPDRFSYTSSSQLYEVNNF